MAFYRIDPWGPERADLNAGIIASTLANCHRDPKRRREPFTPREFMPLYGDQAEEDADDGLAPDKVMSVMDALMRHQERRAKAGLN